MSEGGGPFRSGFKTKNWQPLLMLMPYTSFRSSERGALIALAVTPTRDEGIVTVLGSVGSDVRLDGPGDGNLNETH